MVTARRLHVAQEALGKDPRGLGGGDDEINYRRREDLESLENT
jgi:hypothetical protein